MKKENIASAAIPMSSTNNQPSALHKANLIKINKINNILVLDKNFNAKMDSVHYDNNKLILENSKFLNKVIGINKKEKKEKKENSNLNILNREPNLSVKTKSDNHFRLGEANNTENLLLLKNKQSKGEKSILSTNFTNHEPNSISLNDTSLSIISPLRKGIGTITEILKPNNAYFMSARDLTTSLFNLKQDPQSFKQVGELTLFTYVDGKRENNLMPMLKETEAKGGIAKGSHLNFISSYLSRRQEGESISLKDSLKKTIDLLNTNTKVEIASLNKIKSSSSIAQNVYDSITLTGDKILPKTAVVKVSSIDKKTNNSKNTNNTNINTNNTNINTNNNNNTIIHKYLSNITKSNSHINTNPNLSKKFGILLNYNRSIGYTFLSKILDKNKNTNLISEFKEEIYKLLFYFFKSIFCIISKPTILFSPDKVTIRLFYYLVIPKKKVFKLFAIYNINSYRKEWMGKKINKLLGRKRPTHQTRDINSIQLSNFSEELGFKRVPSKLKNLNSALARNKNISDNNTNSIKKIRLPFMKFKVRKAISRLKSKSTLIREIYLNLRKFNIVKVFHNKFLVLTKILSRLFNKPIVLEITRIHNFKYDSNILANAIQFAIKNKRKNPRVAINKIYRKKNIKLLNDPNLSPINKVITFLSGLNIYINGRLMREPIIPRITTKKFEKGATATGKVNYIDTSFITKKNRKGAYTIKVKSAQNFL